MSVHKLPSYQRRRPEETLLYKTVATHLNTFLANLAEEGKSLPKHVEKEGWAFLECGVLAYGFVRLKCTSCKSEQFKGIFVQKTRLLSLLWWQTNGPDGCILSG